MIFNISILKRFVDEGISTNTVNCDSSIMANKNKYIVSYIMDGWWGGTIKDHMQELKNKWKITPMPAYTEGRVRAFLFRRL